MLVNIRCWAPPVGAPNSVAELSFNWANPSTICAATRRRPSDGSRRSRQVCHACPVTLGSWRPESWWRRKKNRRRAWAWIERSDGHMTVTCGTSCDSSKNTERASRTQPTRPARASGSRREFGFEVFVFGDHVFDHLRADHAPAPVGVPLDRVDHNRFQSCAGRSREPPFDGVARRVRMAACVGWATSHGYRNLPSSQRCAWA